MKRPVVIKAGGELLVPGKTRNRLLRHLCRLQKRGPVLFVHGGGPQIKAELQRKKIVMPMINGRRATSLKAMTVVEQVLSGEINKGIVGELNHLGVKALGLSGRDGKTLTGRPIPGLMRAARPDKTSVALIHALFKAGFFPVMSTVSSDSKGQPVNINADDAASAMAIRLKASRLIFLTDTRGVYNNRKKRIPTLRTNDLPGLIRSGVISGGMIPKVESAATAIKRGVGEIDILFGREGIRMNSGTRIIK